ncbi:MAG TPA: YbhB/YbcL family Raf kinase inhibitor-like protein [Steroidobacteraceae bacterium]|nr:YbhB/YbcL family Raf kinase inhibitor-like protein [Steroidobacteraceae bacterium]
MTRSNRPWITATAICWAALPLAGSAATGFSIDLPTIPPGSRLSDAQVFNGFGCSGRNVSPAIQWSGAPSGTLSYAVTLYDPDAPTGSGWWHWLVYNVPATVSELPEHAGDAGGKSLPSGAVQGRTDFGTAAFGGACPPAGDKPHRYIFTVYALKIAKIDLPADSSAAMVGALLNANELAKRSVTAYYGR